MGNGVAVVSHDKLNLFWRIRQVSVLCAGAGGSVATVQLDVNGVPCTSECTGSTPLTASGVPPIDIGGHDVMHVNITSGPVSANAVVTYYYDEIQGSPSDQKSLDGMV